MSERRDSDLLILSVRGLPAGAVKISNLYQQAGKLLSIYLRTGYPIFLSTKNKIRLHLGSLQRPCIRLEIEILVAPRNFGLNIAAWVSKKCCQNFKSTFTD